MADATKAMTPAQLWPLIHEQRRKVGDMLGTLTDVEWEAASGELTIWAATQSPHELRALRFAVL